MSTKSDAKTIWAEWLVGSYMVLSSLYDYSDLGNHVILRMHSRVDERAHRHESAK